MVGEKVVYLFGGFISFKSSVLCCSKLSHVPEKFATCQKKFRFNREQEHGACAE